MVEGLLAGGHLGFGDDWQQYTLSTIVEQVQRCLAEKSLDVPVIPVGGIFTGTDAVDYLQSGAGAVQVATRVTVAQEAGSLDRAKQAYFHASQQDVVVSKAASSRFETKSACVITSAVTTRLRRRKRDLGRWKSCPLRY